MDRFLDLPNVLGCFSYHPLTRALHLTFGRSLWKGCLVLTRAHLVYRKGLNLGSTMLLRPEFQGHFQLGS